MSMQAIELESTFDTMDDTSSSLSMSMLMIDDSEAEVPTMEEVTSTILEKVGYFVNPHNYNKDHWNSELFNSEYFNCK